MTRVPPPGHALGWLVLYYSSKQFEFENAPHTHNKTKDLYERRGGSPLFKEGATPDTTEELNKVSEREKCNLISMHLIYKLLFCGRYLLRDSRCRGGV